MDTTSVPDSSSSGGSGIGSLIKDAEKKLLPSSWSTRKKKNLAPASYRAAYSKQAKGGVAGSSSTLAPAAGSQTRIIPEDAASSGLQDQGRHAQVQGSTVSTVSSSSSWCLRCTGKLAVTLGPMDAAASDQDMDQGPGPSMHTLRVSAGESHAQPAQAASCTAAPHVLLRLTPPASALIVAKVEHQRWCSEVAVGQWLCCHNPGEGTARAEPLETVMFPLIS